MTINQETPGSRLICGITESEDGKWTSWPPHQHTKDLEEVYCYFDIPKPAFALHLASRKPGEVEAVHPVSDGDCVIVPEGYHPTVGMPGAKSTYFWVMVAHSKESRRYDLAVNDPNFG
jgi:5-deoxy-glucuronate isomerase